MALPTVDMHAVEILSTGGPIHGVGSPPVGDYFTKKQLREMVDAAHELGDEVKPSARIGHSLAGNAVGWLTNIRLNADESKLLADVCQVPARFAELVTAGAYRTRSVELSTKTSQRTGKSYPLIVSGMAWLGDRLPAVSTLDDVVALYEGTGGQLRRVLEIPTNGGINLTKLREAEAKAAAATARVARLERQLARQNATPVIDQAIRERGITEKDRGEWERRFEINAELAKQMLTDLNPNAHTFYENFTQAEHDAERRRISEAYKIPISEVL